MKPLKRDKRAVRRKLQLEAAAETHTPLDFHTEPERQAWIIANAEYFTTIMRKDRTYHRDEWPSLAKAKKAAQRTVVSHPDRVVMIYAVTRDGRDSWVCNVKAGQNAKPT